MNPDNKDSFKKSQSPVHAALAGIDLRLCAGVNPSKMGRTGKITPKERRRMFASGGPAPEGKSFLGRTVRQYPGMSSIGHRVARAAGVIVDENGKLRCPPGTPNANQFTDISMTGCMDAPGPKNIEEQMRDIANTLVRASRDAGMASRLEAVREKHGDLDTIEKQKKALREAFPRADIDLRDRFMDRISPTGRRRVQAARKAFVESLLHEADTFPDVAQHVSAISDALVPSESQEHFGSTNWRVMDQELDLEILMSQFGAADMSKEEFTLSTRSDHNNELEAYWHHVGSHEFGHAMDLINTLDHMGFEIGDDGYMYRPSQHRTDEDFDEQFDDLLEQINELANSDDWTAAELDRLTAELQDLVTEEVNRGMDKNFEQYADLEEYDDFVEIADSEYGQKYYDLTGSIAEAKAEMFARVRIAGYPEEKESDPSSAKIVKPPRRYMGEMFGTDIPGVMEPRLDSSDLPDEFQGGWVDIQATVDRDEDSDTLRRNMWRRNRQNQSSMFGISGTQVSTPEFDSEKVLRSPSMVDSETLEDGLELKENSYTKPKLRNRLKRRIMAGDKGGKAGEWSARKAQLLAQEYRKAGGGYKGRKKKGQRSLEKWTREEWTTSDGKPAKRRDRKGRTVVNRYLPKKAWDKLSPAERRATNRKKRDASKRGRQFVNNTRKARRAGRSVRRKKSLAYFSLMSPETPEQFAYVANEMIRSKAIRTPRDGDGDGFTTNPVTRQDNVPVVPRPKISPEQIQRDMDEAARELRESLGIVDKPERRERGRNAWMFDRPTPVEPTRADPDADPMKEPKNRARIEGASPSTWIKLESLTADIASIIAKHDLQHRERGRLARLQRAIRNTKFGGAAQQLDLDLNPELVKRLYKGLQTLNQLGELDEDLQNLYKKISQLQNRSRLMEFPAVDEKGLESVGIEVKVLGRRASRRATRGVRRMFERVAYDGDNDGFITNPFTGKDEIPWNKGKETREEAIDRFFRNPKNRVGGRKARRIGDMLGGLKRRNAARASDNRIKRRLPDVTENRPVLSSPVSGTPDGGDRSPAEKVDAMIKNLAASKVKDRFDGDEVMTRLGSISASVRDTFGDLETTSDYIEAFKAVGLKVKIKPPRLNRVNPDSERMDIDDAIPLAEKSGLDMALYLLSRNPEVAKNSRIKFDFDRQVSTHRLPRVEVDPATGAVTGVFPGQKVKVTLGQNSIAEFSEGSMLKDTITMQAIQAVVAKSVADGDPPEETLRKAEFVESQMHSLHEMGHAFHHLASSRDLFDGRTPNEIRAAVGDRFDNNYSDIVDGVGREYASMGIQRGAGAEAQLMMVQGMLNEMRGMKEALESMDSDTSEVDEMIAEADAATEALVEEMIASVGRLSLYPELLQRLVLLRRNENGDIEFGGFRPDWQEQLGKIAFDPFLGQLLADAGKKGFYSDSEVNIDNPDFFNELLNLPDDPSFDQRRQALLTTFAGVQQTALRQLIAENDKDDLDAEEWEKLQSVFKYVSSYAKDKNSWYSGNLTGGIPISLEGVAESFSAAMMGVDIDPKAKVAGNQLFAKILAWMNVNLEMPDIPTEVADFGPEDIIGE